MATQQSNQPTRMAEERVQGAGGLQLFIRSWRPGETPRGVVAIVPGFNSHSGHCLWVALIRSIALRMTSRAMNNG